MKFFDAHIHCRGNEAGGFLVGLEGLPDFAGTLSNAEVLSRHDPGNGYLAFYYVTGEQAKSPMTHPLLKYHPRREKYSVDEVIDSIRLSNPVAVMLDTLNEPYWQAYDYWKIARAFPEIPFIFAHAGGYLINDFIKICHFQPNVWIDFALTHTVLGRLGKKPEGLPSIHEAITYSLHAPFRVRVLLASDIPFFDQMAVVAYYESLGKLEMLNSNFQSCMEQLKMKLF